MRNQNPKKKSRKKRIIGLILLLLLLAAALFFLRSASKSSSEALLTAENAQMRDIVTYYSFSGKLTPVSDETQTAKEQLKVKKLYVSEGDVVVKGQPILRTASGTYVNSLYDGTIEKLYVEVNDTLQPGSQIARIIDYSKLEVSVDVDEYDIAAVEIGKEATVYLNALDRSMPATVTEIARSASSEGGVSYYEVKLEIEAGNDVRSGMSVEATILHKQALNVLSISMDALSYDDSNCPYVYQRDANGRLNAVSISTGISDGKYIEVSGGLANGSTVYYQSNDMARFFRQMMEARQ